MCFADSNNQLIVYYTICIYKYSAGYLKDTQEVELKEITEDEDITNVTKRESFFSDPSQATAGGGGQRHTVTKEDDSGVDNGTAESAANDDNDAVPEEFIAYLNEK